MVDTLVSLVMISLLFIIGLYAGKLEYFIGPFSLWLFGKIQSLIRGPIFYVKKLNMEDEQSAGNPYYSYSRRLHLEELSRSALITENLHISDHMNKHVRPKTDEEFGYYLAGLIEGDGYFDDHRLEIVFNEQDAFLAYFIKKQIGYGSVIKLGGPSHSLTVGGMEKKSVRYVLRHFEGLKRVLRLVNGKFLTNYNINQLLKHKFDIKFNTAILPPAIFDLKSNHWLSGFTDAVKDSSFVIHLAISNIDELGFSLGFEFKIKQKNEQLLKLTQQFLGGNIYYVESEQVFFYNSSSFISAKNVVDYFDKYQLNSSKIVRYLKWRKAYRIVQRKEHLTQEGLNKIRKLQGNLRD